MALHTVSLCTGAGGLDLALHAARPDARLVVAVEGEAYAAAVLVARMQAGDLDDAPIWSDLRTFDARAWRGAVDCVVAGYPCQPFSLAGLGLGERDPRHLWPDVARVVLEAEPALVFLENVSAHLRRGFDVVARDLHALGFDVAASVWTAEEVGAPHRRERLFILAAHPERVELRDESGGGSGPGREGAAISRVDGEARALPDAARIERRWLVPSRQSEAHHDGSSSELADADREGELQPLGPDGAERRWAADASWWSSEPAVGRVAHGVADRLDRLRLCGNGVVPAQGAAAFRELATALGIGELRRVIEQGGRAA